MANRPLRLIVCGASGRMGSRVASLAAQDPRFSSAARVYHRGSVAEKDGVPAIEPAELGYHLPQADVLIDFSAPAASVAFAAAAAKARKAIVIGTTGFSLSQLARLKACARKTPVFLSPNFSPGVSLLRRLAAEAARRLPGYDAAVSEIHHNKKKDAPSGTALRLVQTVRDARTSRKPVPAVSQRLGDVVGEHTVTFAGPFERLELTHRAHSRDIFAEGALQAALWLAARKPGLYGMDDMMEAA